MEQSRIRMYVLRYIMWVDYAPVIKVIYQISANGVNLRLNSERLNFTYAQ